MEPESVLVETLVSGGWGLSRTPEGILFSAGVLPGETIAPGPVKKIRGVRHALHSVVLDPSPLRRKPPCPLHETCGGCGFQYASEDVQLHLKAAWVKESLLRLGKQDASDLETVKGKSWAYRHRAQIHRNEAGQVGFLSARSHQLVPADRCPILAPELEQALHPNHPVWRGKNEGRYLMTAFGNNLWTADQKDACMELNGVPFHFSPAGFLQSHLELAEKLRAWMLSAIMQRSPQPGTLWDLYGGTGFWTQLLVREGWKTTIVETYGPNRTHAIRNCPGADFRPTRVEDFLAEQTQAPDWIIADPPRSGFSASVRRNLEKLAPRNLLLVSCSPDTFARDTEHLHRTGYRREHLSLWDFYPQTFHSELVSLWSLQK